MNVIGEVKAAEELLEDFSSLMQRLFEHKEWATLVQCYLKAVALLDVYQDDDSLTQIKTKFESFCGKKGVEVLITISETNFKVPTREGEHRSVFQTFESAMERDEYHDLVTEVHKRFEEFEATHVKNKVWFS